MFVENPLNASELIFPTLEVCHILGHIGIPGEIMPGKLIRTEGLLSQRRDSRTPTREVA